MFRKIKTFFEKLRNQPEETRKTWFYFLVSISMFIIIIIWLISLSLSNPWLGPQKQSAPSQSVSELKNKALGIKDAIYNIAEAIKDFPKIFKGEQATTSPQVNP